MEIKIQSVHFDADQKLIDFVNAKMAKMERFAEDVTAADVTMRLDKDIENGNKVVVARLAVSGPDLIAEARAKSFEEAIDLAIEALKKQAEKHRNK